MKPCTLFAICLILNANPLPAQELLIAAASDLAPLEPSLRQLLARVLASPPRFTFGSSGLLARQVRNGAPYDLFLSANEAFVDELIRDGFALRDSRTVYAVGRVGLWRPAGQVKSLEELLDPGIRMIAIPNPKHAPYGMAAEQLLRGAGLWARLQPKLVYGENVRQAFEFARTGNADVVLTSWTLLRDRGALLLPQPDPPLRQAGAVLTASKQKEAARIVLRTLLSESGRKILTASGLFPVR